MAPDDVVPYFGTGRMAGKECEIAYHNSLMVHLWSMLAEQKVVLSTHSLQQLPVMPESAGWVTYVRCHDDIGWAIMDEYAALNFLLKGKKKFFFFRFKIRTLP